MAKVRVIAAMSGGVDSCVAAALLLEQGYDVVGITMQLWNHKGDGEERFDSCCSLTDVHDARASAHKLGIPHYVVNYEREFKSGVVDYFASEYGQGRTPNPCVLCNSKLKFDHLVDRARALGAEWVATGHYARVIHHGDGRPSELYTGVDGNKDQSYFLFDMRPDNLRRAMFPLGGMTKSQVREKAKALGLHTATKHESQEICFVTGGRYSDFLEKHYPDVTKLTGEIVDRQGRVLGRHDGIHLFTVGQRKGLGAILGGEPRYVFAIQPESRRVVVDSMENLSVQGFTVSSINWLVDPSTVNEERVLSVMVRYRAKPLPCRIRRLENGTYQILLADKARWVTPGQAAVFFDGEQVVGGGFILQAIHEQTAAEESAAKSFGTGTGRVERPESQSLRPTLGQPSADF
ncbi:tRNA-specific 2-thiouridylase MnmA [Planctomyces bekefii]|uniref:tRNA-specific 2-thiouridylase MnmA n=1 Tax=Planctomyces bekefii TaxID=1653850 RepID=A0A5C6MDJ2_9PLAN|nr:tRNA-specific 2-thiouridylase MnmA [Planctomyces bekefii]